MVWLAAFFLLDGYTTFLGLSTGLREMNPLVASMVRLTGFSGLFFSKLFGLALAGYFLRSGRLALLKRATVLMGLVVGWNLLCLAAR